MLCYCCPTSANGNVYGWGRNEENQINESKTKEYPTPIQLEYHNIESIACGMRHTCLYQKGYVTYFGWINGARIPPQPPKDIVMDQHFLINWSSMNQ